MQVITDDPVPTPLLTDSKPHHNEQPPLILSPTDQFPPLCPLGRYFHLDRAHYLSVLELYHFVVTIAVAMVLGQHIESSGLAAFGDQPAR